MIEKIKQYFYYAVLPFSLLFAAIYYLITSKNGLQQELSRAKAEKEFDDVKDRLSEASKDAKQKESDYDRELAAYRAAMDDYRKRNGKLPD